MKRAAIICMFVIVFAAGRTCCGESIQGAEGAKKAKGLSAETAGDNSRMLDIKTIIETKGRQTLSSVVIKFEAINKGRKPVEICRYQTPLERRVTSGTMFKVVDSEGKEVDYEGIQMKWKISTARVSGYALDT